MSTKKIIIDNFNKKKVLNILENEKYEIVFSDVKACNTDFDYTVNLNGENSFVSIKGRVLTKNKNTKKFKIKLNFFGKNQKGILDLHGIADGNSKISFDGIGIISSNSVQADIEIREKVLLFSDKAIAQAIPVLRVETENIKNAVHSASISPINEEIYFYLSSRGISDDKAKKIITEGFLKQS